MWGTSTIPSRRITAALVLAGTTCLPAGVASASGPVYLGEEIVQGGRVMDMTSSGAPPVKMAALRVGSDERPLVALGQWRGDWNRHPYG